jgi:hypothetical protein
MRKLLLTICAVCALGSAAQTADPVPETLYLVGTLSGADVVYPSEGGPEYPLTDADGDGVYTGSFDISAGDLALRVYAKFENSDYNFTYGSHLSEAVPMFDGVEFVTSIVDAFSRDLAVSNWKGGKLDVSVSWKEKAITLTGYNQPEPPAHPTRVYLIGDFNSWQVPEDGNTNGALALGEVEMYLTGMDTQRDVVIPAGASEFKLYTIYSNGQEKFWGADYPEFYLTTSHDSKGDIYVSCANFEIQSSSKIDGVSAFRMKDWNTKGIATVRAAFSWPGYSWSNISSVTMSSKWAPLSPLDRETIYIITETDNEKTIQGLNLSDTNMYAYSTFVGKKGSIIISTEDSLTPAPENCYGLPEDADLQDYYDESYSFNYYPLVKGGKPFEMDFMGEGMCYVLADLGTGVASVSTQLYKVEYEHLYLVGTPQGWDINDDSLSLKLTSPGVFEGTFHMVDNPEFRFFWKLGAWTTDYSIGSGYEDFWHDEIPAEWLEIGEFETGLTKNGLGNWLISGWESGDMKIKVDLNENRLWLHGNGHAGVEGVTADDNEAETEYYNLQGVRVAPDASGLYIVRRGGRTEKVFMNR